MLLNINWKRLNMGRYELLALLLITFAILLRFILIANSWPQTSSEEGTFGLEAMHIAYRGEFPIFMYGQNYMGVLEAYLGAILFHLFGVSLFSLRLGMLIFFGLFLLGMYYLTKLLYSTHMALITLIVLSVGSTGILVPELIVTGGTVETLLFGTLLLLLATRLSLSSEHDMSTRKKWLRIAGFTAWRCCAGLGLWSHLLVAPFVLVSGLLLLLFCRRELRTRISLALFAGLVIGLFPLIVYNATATFGHDSLSTFLQLYNAGTPSVPDPHLIQKQLSGTFLYSLPYATGMNTLCGASKMPFFSATPTPVSCLLEQGGWSLAYLVLLAAAIGIASGGLHKLRKLHRGSRNNWSAEERLMAIQYTAQLMLLLSAAITIFLFAHSPNAASRPWSTRYLVGLLIATPAVLWPLCNGIGTGIRLFSHRMTHIRLTVLFRYTMLVLLLCLFTMEMLSTTTQIPSIEARNVQDTIITRDLMRMGVVHIYSGYWECDRFVFLTQEKIICSVVNEDISAGLTRYAPYSAIVHADPGAAYVFTQNSAYEKNFEKRTYSNTQFQKMVLDGYVVYRPKLNFIIKSILQFNF
ncbi:MAG: ArnT family glycosyltransferase [Ktedonobacteraceae bacterium]